MQTGDFRTRISVYDLDVNERTFDSERVAFQYEHNYWKLPVAMDDTSVIHTSGMNLQILLDLITSVITMLTCFSIKNLQS